MPAMFSIDEKKRDVVTVADFPNWNAKTAVDPFALKKKKGRFLPKSASSPPHVDFGVYEKAAFSLMNRTPGIEFMFRSGNK